MKEIASVVMSEWIDNETLNPRCSASWLNFRLRRRFSQKMRVYRIAMALSALEQLRQNGRACNEIQRRLEARIFGRPSDEGLLLLGEVRQAMADLNALLAEKKELSWAHNWLLAVGIDETDPVELALFSSSIMNRIRCAMETFHEIAERGLLR